MSAAERPTGGQLARWWGVLLAGGGLGFGVLVLAFGGPLQLPLIAFGLGVLLITVGWLADHA